MSENRTTLHDKLKIKLEDTEVELSSSITGNLKNPLRPYQTIGTQHLIYANETNRDTKDLTNKHFLFQMATGSGKTQMMASNILYLYEKGYRNFIFFVNSTNILTKTKSNFADKQSKKYLFKQTINIDGKNVNIRSVDSFDGNNKDINIILTTVQKLHYDMINPRENAMTMDTIGDYEIVLFADEAHHLNAKLKNGALPTLEAPTWGNTVEKILKANLSNMLIEFTATSEMKALKEIYDHYQDKLVFNYDFKSFNDDKFCKTPVLIHSDMGDKYRIVQAIMLSEYRKMIAEDGEINLSLKPVVLFKNPQGIARVDASFDEFEKLIDRLSIADIDEVFKRSDIDAIKLLHERIKDDKQGFLHRLQRAFSIEKCVKIYSTSKDKQETLDQLNSLEDKDNHIRAVFAVNVLNEGWDVLNLFDVVKLDEAKKGEKNTTQDAQLIGRGARYYPFIYKNDKENRYKRKFDDMDSVYTELETMAFHSVNNSEYIKSLKTSMSDLGIPTGGGKKFTYKLKDEFANSEFIRNGIVFTNGYEEASQEEKGMEFYYPNYKSFTINVDNDSSEYKLLADQEQKTIKSDMLNFADIDKNIGKGFARSMLNRHDRFSFANLKQSLPALRSIDEFLSGEGYLGDTKISLHTTKPFSLDDVGLMEYIVDFVLWKIDFAIEKKQLKRGTYFTGMRWVESGLVMRDGDTKLLSLSKQISKQETYKKINISDDWYMCDEHYGTSEEKSFVDFMASNIKDLQETYDEVYLFRNERVFAIYTFEDGTRFEPDFMLFIEDKSGLKHQIFCEPKGEHLATNDKEIKKNEFLQEIAELTKNNEMPLFIEDDFNNYIETDRYKLWGLPFYTESKNVEFANALEYLQKDIVRERAKIETSITKKAKMIMELNR